MSIVIQHTLTAAKMPSQLEPSGLHRADGKRPNGMTMVPWEQGKYLVCDAKCRHFLPVTLSKSSHRAGGAAAHAEEDRTRTYAHLDHMYQFHPVAMETCGTIGLNSRDFSEVAWQTFKGSPTSTNPGQYLSASRHVGYILHHVNMTCVLFMECQLHIMKKPLVSTQEGHRVAASASQQFLLACIQQCHGKLRRLQIYFYRNVSWSSSSASSDLRSFSRIRGKLIKERQKKN